MDEINTAGKFGDTGQLGMDLARFDPRRRVREAVATDPARAVPISRAGTSVKLGLSFGQIFLFAFFMSILLCIVFSYSQLSVLNRGNAQLLDELNAALKEQNVLTAELESRIKLDEIADAATNRLGLVKLDRRQIVYINMSGEEKVEILAAVPLKNKIMDIISGIFK